MDRSPIGIPYQVQENLFYVSLTNASKMVIECQVQLKGPYKRKSPESSQKTKEQLLSLHAELVEGETEARKAGLLCQQACEKSGFRSGGLAAWWHSASHSCMCCPLSPTAALRVTQVPLPL